MAALPITQPAHVMFDQGMVSSHVGIHLGNSIYILWSDGAPTGGAGWAGPGTMVIDYTTTGVDVYFNTGTKATPTWTKKVD